MHQPASNGWKKPKFKPGDKVVRVGMLGLFGMPTPGEIFTVKSVYFSAQGQVIYTLQEAAGSFPEYSLRLHKEKKEDAEQPKNKQALIDKLLDEANDYRRLYYTFGDREYRRKELRAYEKLREVLK